jgi:hypothetical protein
MGMAFLIRESARERCLERQAYGKWKEIVRTNFIETNLKNVHLFKTA